jgi:hypothetical protein
MNDWWACEHVSICFTDSQLLQNGQNCRLLELSVLQRNIANTSETIFEIRKAGNHPNKARVDMKLETGQVSNFHTQRFPKT